MLGGDETTISDQKKKLPLNFETASFRSIWSGKIREHTGSP